MGIDGEGLRGYAKQGRETSLVRPILHNDYCSYGWAIAKERCKGKELVEGGINPIVMEVPIGLSEGVYAVGVWLWVEGVEEGQLSVIVGGKPIEGVGSKFLVYYLKNGQIKLLVLAIKRPTKLFGHLIGGARHPLH